MHAFSRLVSRLYGRDVPFNQIYSFDLGKSFNLPEDELKRFMHLAHQPEVLVEEVEPVERSREALTEWAIAGAHITIVTGRPTSSYKATLEWLRRHDVPYHSLRFVREYGRGHLDGPIQPLDIRTLSRASLFFRCRGLGADGALYRSQASYTANSPQ